MLAVFCWCLSLSLASQALHWAFGFLHSRLCPSICHQHRICWINQTAAQVQRGVTVFFDSLQGREIIGD